MHLGRAVDNRQLFAVENLTHLAARMVGPRTDIVQLEVRGPVAESLAALSGAFSEVGTAASNTGVILPSDPKVSPDRTHLVTADFCETRCVNELAVWRVTRDGIHKEWTWKPRDPWSDAVASWKSADTIAIEYTPAGTQSRSRVERRLDDPSWVRAGSP